MSNKHKDELLGMPHGTANGKLTKMILFDFAERLNLLNCFRCGRRIETLRDLSVEHKEAWMSAVDPRASYFDLNNIAFSHLSCNSSEGRATASRNQAAAGYPKLQEARKIHAEKGYPGCKAGVEAARLTGLELLEKLMKLKEL